jgi:hypothetical protein
MPEGEGWIEQEVIVTRRFCTGCKWLELKPFVYKGRDVTAYNCMHPQQIKFDPDGRMIGMTNETPNWCPVGKRDIN